MNSGLFTGVNDLQEFEDGVFAQHEHDEEEDIEVGFETGFIDTLFNFDNLTQVAANIVQVDTEDTDHDGDGDSWNAEDLCDE